MFVSQAEAGQTVDGKRLRHEPGSGGAIEVPARQTRDRPALQEDFQRFAVFGRRLKPFGQDDLARGDRVEQRQ